MKEKCNNNDVSMVTLLIRMLSDTSNTRHDTIGDSPFKNNHLSCVYQTDKRSFFRHAWVEA